MADKPIIFAMANPDPEITPEEVAEVRQDAIMATGRSDYPNQINNVLGFPYIFRGALDVRATAINMEMKIAAAHALAALAREDVPDEVAVAYGARPKYGSEYIIPVPFDPRLIATIPPAVAKAAMETGVARKPIPDMDAYRAQLASRRDPVAGILQRVYQRLRRRPQRVVFAEGEEEQVIRAAASFVHQGLGSALLVGREDRVRETARGLGVELGGGIEIINAALSQRNSAYAAYLYERLQRKGYLLRDVHRLVNQDRNHFAACMVALGDADAMVTGVTRNFSVALEDVCRCIDPKPGHRVMGVSLVLARGRTVLVADTAVNEMPNAEVLADIAVEAAGVARRLGYDPRLALLAFSTFGHPESERSAHVQGAVRILDQRHVDFEYDGDMAADVALNMDLRDAYPFCRLSGPANVLIMPAFHSASIVDQAAHRIGRRHRDRPDPGRARPAGADRVAVRQRRPAGQHGGAGGVQRERLRPKPRTAGRQLGRRGSARPNRTTAGPDIDAVGTPRPISGAGLAASVSPPLLFAKSANSAPVAGAATKLQVQAGDGRLPQDENRHGQYRFSQEGRAPDGAPHGDQQGAPLADAKLCRQGRGRDCDRRSCPGAYRPGRGRARHHAGRAAGYRSQERRQPESVAAHPAGRGARQVAIRSSCPIVPRQCPARSPGFLFGGLD